MIILHKVNIIIYNLYTECFLFTVREFSVSEENAHLHMACFWPNAQVSVPMYLNWIFIAVTNALAILY